METTRLANGVTIATRTLPGSSATAVGLWLLNGSRHQHEDQSGYAHFVEHLLFKGAGEFDARGLAERFETMGGQVNAHTGKELTALHGYVPNGDVTELVRLFAAMLLAPRFTERDVEIEKDIVFQEMAMVRDNPEELLEEEAVASAWPGHAMGWPILGTASSIETLDADAMHAYLRGVLCGQRLVVVTFGGARHETVTAACDDLGALPGGSRPAVPAPQFSPIQLQRRYGHAQSSMIWLMPAPPVTAPTYSAHVLANHILGGGTTSRLFQEVREERGLVYDIHAQLDLYSDTGLWAINTGCEPAQRDECRAAVEQTVERLLHRGPDEQELETTRRFAQASLHLEQNNHEASMERMARELIYMGRTISAEEHLARLARVSVADVQTVLSEAWSQRGFASALPR